VGAQVDDEAQGLCVRRPPGVVQNPSVASADSPVCALAAVAALREMDRSDRATSASPREPKEPEMSAAAVAKQPSTDWVG